MPSKVAEVNKVAEATLLTPLQAGLLKNVVDAIKMTYSHVDTSLPVEAIRSELPMLNSVAANSGDDKMKELIRHAHFLKLITKDQWRKAMKDHIWLKIHDKWLRPDSSIYRLGS